MDSKPDPTPLILRRSESPSNSIKSTHRRPSFLAGPVRTVSPPKSHSVFDKGTRALILSSGQAIELSPVAKNYQKKVAIPVTTSGLSSLSPELKTPLPQSSRLCTLFLSQQTQDDRETADDDGSTDEECPEKSVEDLQSKLRAYDNTPIYIVPNDYTDLVASTFAAGMYGLDTESDCQTGHLRIIQIYTGERVYIFDVQALDPRTDNYLVKFLKSKDRIKVGVDIDGDIFRMKKYVCSKRHTTSDEQKHKYKFTVNGTIDVQSIAHSLGEKLLSLDKLAYKFVEDFTGNPSNLGSFVNPTDDQYIYAANDAVLSLKIYYPLVNRNPSNRWLSSQGPAADGSEESEEALLKNVLTISSSTESKAKPKRKTKNKVKKSKTVEPSIDQIVAEIDAEMAASRNRKRGCPGAGPRWADKRIISKPVAAKQTASPFYKIIIMRFKGMIGARTPENIEKFCKDIPTQVLGSLSPISNTMICMQACLDHMSLDVAALILEQIIGKFKNLFSEVSADGSRRTYSYLQLKEEIFDNVPLLKETFPNDNDRILAAFVFSQIIAGDESLFREAGLIGK